MCSSNHDSAEGILALRYKRLFLVSLMSLSIILAFGFLVPIISVDVQSPCGPYMVTEQQSLFYHVIGIGYHTHPPYCL